MYLGKAYGNNRAFFEETHSGCNDHGDSKINAGYLLIGDSCPFWVGVLGKFLAYPYVDSGHKADQNSIDPKMIRRQLSTLSRGSWVVVLP